MISRDSASPSSPSRRKPDSFLRGRTLKRGGVAIRPTSEEDIKYAWAAYRRGAFEEVEAIKEGLSAVDFTAAFVGLIQAAYGQGTQVQTALADTPHGNIPVGIITLDTAERIVYPHVLWFPEASPRNKIEIGVKFFRDIKKKHLPLVISQERDVGYFKHLGKYGLLRLVGKIRHYNEDGTAVFLFQGVK